MRYSIRWYGADNKLVTMLNAYPRTDGAELTLDDCIAQARESMERNKYHVSATIVDFDTPKGQDRRVWDSTHNP